MKAILILSAFVSAVASVVLGILYANGGVRLPIQVASSPPPASSPAPMQAQAAPPAPSVPAAGRYSTAEASVPARPAVPIAPSPEPVSVAPAPNTASSRYEPGGSSWSDRRRVRDVEDVVLRVTNEAGWPISVEVDRACDEITLVTAPEACLPVLRVCDVRSFRVRAGEYRITLDGRPQGERIAFDPRCEYVLEVVRCDERPDGAMVRLVEGGRVVFQTMLGGAPRHADVHLTDPVGVGFPR